jgi:hypothetical protein
VLRLDKWSTEPLRAFDPGERIMSRLLLIVAATAPARLLYFKHLYGSETVEVILDRRAGQRRRGRELVVRERRRSIRRRRDVAEEIKTFGWALVRR